MQILVQHIKAVLPGLKSRISSALVSVAKEHASYGEITESKVCYMLKLSGESWCMFTPFEQFLLCETGLQASFFGSLNIKAFFLKLYTYHVSAVHSWSLVKTALSLNCFHKLSSSKKLLFFCIYGFCTLWKFSYVLIRLVRGLCFWIFSLNTLKVHCFSIVNFFLVL